MWRSPSIGCRAGCDVVVAEGHEGRGDASDLEDLGGGAGHRRLGLGGEPQGGGHADRGRAPGSSAALRARIESGRALLLRVAPGPRGPGPSELAGQAGRLGVGPERLAGGSGAGAATVRLGLDLGGSALRHSSCMSILDWYKLGLVQSPAKLKSEQ